MNAAAPRRSAAWIGAAAAVVSAVVLGVLVIANASPAAAAFPAGALALLVVWIVWQDVKTYTIPDTAVLALAVLAVALRWHVLREQGSLNEALTAVAIDAILPGGMLFLFREAFYRRKGYDGLGFGDVKLAAAGGILVGAVGFSWALFMASAIGLAFVAVSRGLSTGRLMAGADKLAFGAILAPALYAVWVAQQVPALAPYAAP